MSMLLCVCVPESTNTLVARLLVKLEQMEFNWINTLKQFKLSSSSSCRIIFNITPSTAPLSRAINFGCQRILNLLIDFHPNQMFSFVSFTFFQKRFLFLSHSTVQMENEDTCSWNQIFWNVCFSANVHE